MRFNVIEVVVGALVLIVAMLFLGFAYKSSHWQGPGRYTIHAKFDRIDGLSMGSDVRISGVKVGSITHLNLDEQTFMAHTQLSLLPSVKIPMDSVAEIVGDGLFGPKYLSIIPGNSEETLAEGAFISRTQSAVSLESLMGKFLFNKSEDDGKKSSDTNASRDVSP